MLAVLVFIIILGILIFVHELGHFVVARRNGIRAYEFGFGFPPRIFGVQKVTDPQTGKKRWRTIWGRHDGDDENEVIDIEEIENKGLKEDTIYSINWIPLGGFVKIKGEDGGHRGDLDSFSTKGAWTRTKVLAAGVIMNFILAWFVISLGLFIGAPQAVESGMSAPNSKIQIAGIVENSPASAMGLKIGDEVVKTQISSTGEVVKITNVEDLQNYINSQKGQKINLDIIRGKQAMTLSGTPRVDSPSGQGPLGIELAETQVVSYPWYEAIWKGLVMTGNLIMAILVAFFGLLKSLFMGKSVGAEVTGPVGIAMLTSDVTKMGFVYILQFMALLSINLGIINALPIPALDGGRILFVIIEKIKGKPVTQKVEQMFHTAFFVLLILLMVVVTFHDVSKLFNK